MATMLPANPAASGRLADTLSGLFHRVISPEEGQPRIRRVGVVVVDGLGADLLMNYSGHARFLSSLLRDSGAIVNSGLPSTTASALASITTGVSAGEHGLLGYQVRDPDSGEIVNHLKPFPPGVDPLQWQPRPTLFEQAAARSIPSIAVGESRFSGTDFSRAILRGAEFRGSGSLDSHHEILREFFDSVDEGLAYLYWPALDRIGHQLGVTHSNWVDALETVDHFVAQLHKALRPDEGMILTADHGMVDVLPDHQVWWPSDHPLRSQIQQWAGEPRLVQLYLHSDVDTLERVDILRDLRRGEFDVLVGINLLREGLDLPEVSLVGILDADKEGFLRSSRSLIQTTGRAARNVSGQVIMYAERITDAMRHTIEETERRRARQAEYNEERGITPQTIRKSVLEMDPSSGAGDYVVIPVLRKGETPEDPADIPARIEELRSEMLLAAEELEFEKAAELRDQVEALRAKLQPGKRERPKRDRGSQRPRR